MRVNLGERSYDIVIEPGALDRTGELAAAVARGRQAAVVTNDVVGPIYAERVELSLNKAGFRTAVLSVPDGEEQKTLANAGLLCEQMVLAKLDRRSVVIALGGGVIGDLAGFAAAIYLRGVDLVQIPTSLLAQVDSSIGGKTAVNLPQGKNLVGAFHQPRLVIIDPETLATLPERELSSGLAEIIKHGIIESTSGWKAEADANLFRFLEESVEDILHLDTEAIGRAIGDSCEIKASVVAADEHESDLRAILNCGHTVGHAVEAAAGYGQYRHGEAVAIGLVIEALLAEKIGLAKGGTAERIATLVKRAGLPTRLGHEIPLDTILQAMSVDKKARNGKIRFVLPKDIGEVRIVEDVSMEDILQVFKESWETAI